MPGSRSWCRRGSSKALALERDIGLMRVMEECWLSPKQTIAAWSESLSRTAFERNLSGVPLKKSGLLDEAERVREGFRERDAMMLRHNRAVRPR